MIIDFRIRPPYKGHMDTVIFKNLTPPADPAQWSIFDLGKERIPSAEQRSMELFIEEMRETGTTTAVIMGRKADHNGEVDNDEIHELQQRYPQLFVAFGGVNPFLPGQVEEVERLHRLGFRGVGIDAGWLRTPLHHNSPHFFPIYEKCQELNLIVSLTSSFFLGPNLSFSSPDHIQEVAMRFPRLRIVVPHACWPHVSQALAMAILCPNVYLMPDCYVYIPHFPQAEEYIIAANTYLKHRVLYASSYPVRSLRQSLEGWTSRAFTPEALENTLYRNAQRLLEQ